METVDQPAAEREPDNVTPTFTHAPRCDFSLMRVPTADAKCSCPQGQPDHVTPDVRHFAALADAYTTCGLERATVRWTDDPETPVDCPECAGKLVDEQLADTDIRSALAADLDRMGLMPEPEQPRDIGVDAARDLAWGAYGMSAPTGEPEPDPITPEVYAEHFPERDDSGKPVESERRTVSLEVLTDELRAVPMDYEQETGATNYPPTDANVGVVVRYADKPVQVTDVDSEWSRDKRARSTAAIFGLMLTRAAFVADDHEGAELLMPTPDVLAALDGRPDATFWTAPVPVTARAVEEGWLVVGYSGPGMEERVEAKNTDCGEADCPWPGDCTQLTIGADKPQHFADWTTLTVRIPAGVTR